MSRFQDLLKKQSLFCFVSENCLTSVDGSGDWFITVLFRFSSA